MMVLPPCSLEQMLKQPKTPDNSGFFRNVLTEALEKQYQFRNNNEVVNYRIKIDQQNKEVISLKEQLQDSLFRIQEIQNRQTLLCSTAIVQTSPQHQQMQMTQKSMNTSSMASVVSPLNMQKNSENYVNFQQNDIFIDERNNQNDEKQELNINALNEIEHINYARRKTGIPVISSQINPDQSVTMPDHKSYKTKIPIISSQINQLSPPNKSRSPHTSGYMYDSAKVNQLAETTLTADMIIQENKLLKEQVLLYKLASQAASKFLDQQMPRFVNSSTLNSKQNVNKLTIVQKFEALSYELQKFDQKNFRLDNSIQHLNTTLQQKDKQLQQQSNQIKQLQNKLDEKDIELLKQSRKKVNLALTQQIQKSLANQSLRDSLPPQLQDSAIIRVSDKSLKDNIEFIKSEIKQFQVSDIQQKIEEILVIISDICYGNQFIELKKLFSLEKAKDFDELRNNVQLSWREGYDELIDGFIQKKTTTVKLNEFTTCIDEQEVGLGSQLAIEILNGLLVGYEFGGQGDIPCLQITLDGLTEKIELGSQ